MNIWERYERAMSRAAGAHTEGDTAYGDLQVFNAHALCQRDHVAKLQSKIVRQAAVIDGRDPVSKERDYWKAEAERVRIMYRSLRQSMMGTYGKFDKPVNADDYRRLYWHSFDWTKAMRHDTDALIYAFGRPAYGRTFSTTPEQMARLREQSADMFRIYDVEPVEPTLRERIGDAWIDVQFWIADKLEDAAEWLRAR